MRLLCSWRYSNIELAQDVEQSSVERREGCAEDLLDDSLYGSLHFGRHLRAEGERIERLHGADPEVAGKLESEASREFDDFDKTNFVEQAGAS